MTATYQRPGTVATLAIEVAFNGDGRAGNDQSGYSSGPDISASRSSPGRAGHRSSGRPTPLPPGWRTSRVGDQAFLVAGRSINGRTSTRYLIDGTHHHPGTVPLVISRDHSRAKLAAGYRRYVAM